MIRLGLVGMGKWGSHYKSVIQKIPGCQLPEENIKSKNYKDLFNNKDINGIIIATPASTHYEIAKGFLERGFNVLIEKPHVLNLKQALQLLDLQKKTKTVGMIGHIYLYNSAFLIFKEKMKKIKEIQYVKSEGMNYGPFRTDVTPLWDWLPHDLSMTTELFGLPESIQAWGGTIKTPLDMCFVKLSYRKLNVFIEAGSYSPIKKRAFSVIGKEEALTFDDIQKKKLILHNLETSSIKYLSYPKKESPLANQVREFLQCIKQNKKPKTDFVHGYHVIKILTAIEESIKKNGKEKLLISN